MPIRAVPTLLLLLPVAASAQELDLALHAVVKIWGTREDQQVRGSGFVVGLEPGKATIVTASHVIEGMLQFEVTFAVNPTERFDADPPFGMDLTNPNGLAVFQVRGAVPMGVTALSFEVENRPRQGEELFLVGFPYEDLAPRTPRRVLVGRRGTLLLVDQKIGEGFSGSPVLQSGRVVGVVTDMDEESTFAANAVVAREALEGWGVRLGQQATRATEVSEDRKHAKVATTEAPPSPPVSKEPAQKKTNQLPASEGDCRPGEKRPENGIDFVRICGGSFMMGSDETDYSHPRDEIPAHLVTLSEFWISKTEISADQYRTFDPSYRRQGSLPANTITWFQASAACEHFGGALPTEAQWEYAARAGSTTPWSFGDDERLLNDYAWHLYNSDGEPHPVATKKPNDWGIYDMHGNVEEWVSDYYGPYSSSTEIDPTGPPRELVEVRVLRGGSFMGSPSHLRSASRSRGNPKIANRYGFRCVLDPDR